MALSTDTADNQPSRDAQYDFIAVSTHQIRTEINKIKWGMGELIDATKNEEERKSYTQIFESAERMGKLFEDFLQFIKVACPDMKEQPSSPQKT